LLLLFLPCPAFAAVMVPLGPFVTPPGVSAYMGVRYSAPLPTPAPASLWRMRGTALMTPTPKRGGELDTLWVSESETKWPYGGTVYRARYVSARGDTSAWSNVVVVAAGIPQDYFKELWGPWYPGTQDNPLGGVGFHRAAPNALRPDVLQVVFRLQPAASYRLFGGQFSPVTTFQGWLERNQPGGGQ